MWLKYFLCCTFFRDTSGYLQPWLVVAALSFKIMSAVKSKDLDPAKEDDDDDDKEIEEPNDDNDDGFRAASESNVKYTLWSAGKLDKLSNLDTGACGRAAGSKGIEYECRSWSELRNFLSSNFYKHYPTLERDLVTRRRELLLGKGAIDEGYRGDTKEFTVIGFTQRTYRRAWLNLPSILEDYNLASFEQAV